MCVYIYIYASPGFSDKAAPPRSLQAVREMVELFYQKYGKTLHYLPPVLAVYSRKTRALSARQCSNYQGP